MRAKRSYRLLLLLLCAVIVLLPAMTDNLSGAHIRHSCKQERCTVCAILQSVRHLLRLFSIFSTSISLALACLFGSRALSNRRSFGEKSTPITLKVRMNP